jgi:probable rRNA maturation factor
MMPRVRGRLSVVVVGASRVSAARGLGPWLERHAPRNADGDVAIRLVGEIAMARLNGRFRRHPVSTDVLSFPSGASGPGGFLGDIAIATPVAKRQAAHLGHGLSTELKVLALHGLLHLLGYDHERDRGEMRAAETRLRRRAGLPAGLVERAHVASTGQR